MVSLKCTSAPQRAPCTDSNSAGTRLSNRFQNTCKLLQDFPSCAQSPRSRAVCIDITMCFASSLGQGAVIRYKCFTKVCSAGLALLAVPVWSKSLMLHSGAGKAVDGLECAIPNRPSSLSSISVSTAPFMRAAPVMPCCRSFLDTLRPEGAARKALAACCKADVQRNPIRMCPIWCSVSSDEQTGHCVENTLSLPEKWTELAALKCNHVYTNI
jgi:hypothetical protein